MVHGAGAGSGAGAGGEGKVFYGDKLTKAQSVFAKYKYLQGTRLTHQAAYVGVSPDQLNRWLQRQRAKKRIQQLEPRIEQVQGENEEIQQLEPQQIEQPLGENEENQQFEGENQENQRQIQQLEPRIEQVQGENEEIQQLEPQQVEQQIEQPQIEQPLGENEEWLDHLINWDQVCQEPCLSNVPEPLVTPHAFKEYSKIADDALIALHDLFTNESLWYKSSSGDFLINEEEHGKRYPSPNNPNPLLESSYDEKQVRMDATLLARRLTKGNWDELFPAIVLKASIMQTWSNGESVDNPDGTMHLIENNLMVASHLVPGRNYIFLRKCKLMKRDPIEWMIADTFVEKLQEMGHPILANCLRLASGCLITATGNGTCLVQWIEHTRVPNQFTTEKAFKYIIENGLPYQANRWTASLGSSVQRINHRSTCSTQDNSRLMDVSQRMILQFMKGRLDQNIIWRDVFKMGDINSFATLKSANDYLVVPGGSVTFYLPSPSRFVFECLYHHFDDIEIIEGQSSPTRLLCLQTSDDEPANTISLYRVSGDTVEIREASCNNVESFIVRSRVEENTFSGTTPPKDIPFIEFFGVTVTSTYDHRSIASTSTSSSNTPTGDGSVVTLALQMPARISWKQQNPEMMSFMKFVMRNLVEKVKEIVGGAN